MIPLIEITNGNEKLAVHFAWMINGIRLLCL